MDEIRQRTIRHIRIRTAKISLIACFLKHLVKAGNIVDLLQPVQIIQRQAQLAVAVPCKVFAHLAIGCAEQRDPDICKLSCLKSKIILIGQVNRFLIKIRIQVKRVCKHKIGNRLQRNQIESVLL